MRRSRYDSKLLLAAQAREGILVQFDDRFVQAADDEQSWRLDAGQRIEKQRRQSRVAQTACNELVARAVTAAARTVRKQHDTAAFLTDIGLAFKHRRARGDARFKRIAVTGICHAIAHRETSAPGSRAPHPDSSQ